MRRPIDACPLERALVTTDIDSRAEPVSSSTNQELVDAIFAEVKRRLLERHHVPAATYRLQFNKFFTFQQGRELASYLDRLGISDIYASPYFRARAESLHGYDIANHNELNPSIGTEEDLDAMLAELHRRDMCHILDTVPNHMGIGEEGNAWWMDVLENGRSSLYAPYFDIDWDPINTKLTNKVLLPILGEQYGKVLENKELQVNFAPEEGRFYLCYWEKTFPIDPRSYQAILDYDKARLLEELGEESDASLEYQSILTALDHLPAHSETERERILERNREKEVIKRRLAALCASEPRVREFIERNVGTFNGVPGEPHSFDLLDALLERQPYRLSFWRVATEEINYRRFFDVNELAAVRIDQPAVFEETHRMIMRFLREEKLNGLRIDHVDGLYDPAKYFQDLQHSYFLEVCRLVMDEMGEQIEGIARPQLESLLLGRFDAERMSDPQGVLNRPLYVVVEKILARGESLPGDWVVYGTTGYEFTNDVNGLFVDSANARAFDEIYNSVIGEKVKFADLVYQSKQRIMRLSLSSEINVLTNMLNRISERDRHYRDFTLNGIRNAIREVIACFPVYRTYITPETTEIEKRDQAHIERAVGMAKKRNPAVDPSAFDFLGDILMLKGFDDLPPEECADRTNFVMKFQQVTGPVIAKGLEDTAFYVYNRLISLNEVGGEPGYFGISPAAFHKAQAERQRHWPFSLLTTSTHDTKRSEDVRMRINVLSEIPQEWRTAFRRWARTNRKYKRAVEGQLAPSPNEEYFLYQTLVGVWPLEENLSEEAHQEVVERVQAYMRKAMNEAKVNTSWVNPNEPYQQAVADFIATILRRDEDNRFLADFLPFQRRVAHYGLFNSLSQVLIKLTSPGVPDIYQGNEIWDFSLVDPDNRRPVDYDLRRGLLSQVEKVKDAGGAASLVESKEDGRIKLLVTSRALNFRRSNLPLFQQGSYTPITVEGKHAGNIISFARSYEGSMAVAVAPCLMTQLGKAGETVAPVGQVWAGSWLPLPGASDGDSFHNVFTGEVLAASPRNGSVGLPLEEVLAVFPVALLEKV
ncbi:MAG: (1-_4)-alpha-D-glucan 1-alpha-D-glucosylmutase [Chloroflexia bacterium]|nr:(1->4)-alpha-D-glucan 1-alpha-D-glucosylmutase [Chloroflexia bacterium]